MSRDPHVAGLEAQIDELKRMVALLIARTGHDHVEFTDRELMDVPSCAGIVTWRNRLEGGVTVALRGMPPVDGIVDAEWTEDPGPRALAAGG